MSNFIGHIDIEYDEIKKYVDAVEKKRGTCDILPRARFNIVTGTEDGVHYSSLVCSNKMGGKQTGISAEWCKNCIIREEE